MTALETKKAVAKSQAIQMCAEIRATMNENEISTATLAFEAGESPGHLTDILNGKKLPGLARYLKIKDALTVLVREKQAWLIDNEPKRADLTKPIMKLPIEEQ